MGRFTIALGLTVFMLSGFTISGCSPWDANRNPPRILSDQEISELRAEVQAIGDRCRSLRLSGAVNGYTASVQCSNPGILAAYQKIDFPYMSLLNLALARRLQLAERVDAKKISEGDMLVEFYSDVRGLPAMSRP